MWSQNDCLCRGVVEWDIKALTPGGHKYTVTDGSADGHHYDNDMRCKWKLYTTPKANVQEVILLKFPAFELEPNQFCMFYDYVSVSWQDHTGTNKVKTLCNNRMGQVDTIEITGEHPLTNPVTVKFKSSRSNTFSGFKIEPSVATQVRKNVAVHTWNGLFLYVRVFAPRTHLFPSYSSSHHVLIFPPRTHLFTPRTHLFPLDSSSSSTDPCVAG